MFSVENLKAELNTTILSKNVIYYPQIGSTNSIAWKFIDENCKNGTVFVTDYQYQGKGRRQNSWSASDGKSLTFSFVLYPDNNLNNLGLLPLLTGISIVNGIQNAIYIQPGLKWPNDIMLSRKKMGGILIESKSSNSGLGIVVGIGLNINETKLDFSDTIKDDATSLKLYSGEHYSREKIMAEILNEFELLYNGDWNNIISNWYMHCIHEGSEVSFNTEDGKFKGKFKGLTEYGHAEIIIDGKEKIFSSGMVTV